MTVAQRETSPDYGARIRDCSWCCQSSAMELLTQQFFFFSYESSLHWSVYVTVHSSQYCSLGNRQSFYEHSAYDVKIWICFARKLVPSALSVPEIFTFGVCWETECLLAVCTRQELKEPIQWIILKHFQKSVLWRISKCAKFSDFFSSKLQGTSSYLNFFNRSHPVVCCNNIAIYYSQWHNIY
jgi:hypothetical protein